MSYRLKLEDCPRLCRAIGLVRRISAFRAVIPQWTCLVFLVAMTFRMVPAAYGQEPLELTKAAHASAIDKLKSGEGRGYYREFDDNADTPSLEFTFQLAFDDDKFRLELEYLRVRPTNQDFDRKIIVSDGSAAFVTRYSDRIHPAGCETSVYEPDRQRLASALSYPALNHRRFGLLSVDDLELFDPFSGTGEELDNGRFLYRLQKGRRETRMEVAPEYGYLVSLAGGATTSPRTSAFFRYKWRKTNDIWNVEETTVERNYLDGKKRREVLKYEEFEPNVEVPPETFTMAALGMCENSRIIDRRPDAKTRIYRYDTEKAAKITEEKLDGMLVQLNDLSAQAIREPLEEAEAVSVWRIAAICVGLLALLCLAYVAYRKWVLRV